MSTSLLTRACPALAAAAFFLSLGLEPGLARTPQGAWTLRAGTVSGHSQRLGWRGNSWNWRSPHGWNRWSRNSWSWNQAGLYDSGYWFWPYASDGPAVDGDGPTVVIGGRRSTSFPQARLEASIGAPKAVAWFTRSRTTAPGNISASAKLPSAD